MSDYYTYLSEKSKNSGYTIGVKKAYTLKAKVWLWPGDAAWHFVTVDKKTSTEIREKHSKPRRGFGSIPVSVTLGKTKWKTSIFPDTKSSTYLLPLKVAVRKKEGVFEGDAVTFTLQISR